MSISGLILVALRYAISGEDPFSAHPHTFWPWVIMAHVLAIPAFFFFVGSVWRQHVQLYWTRRRRRASGAFLLALLFVAAVSGYLLYFLGSERSLDITRLVHAAVGVLGVVVALCHTVAGWKLLAKPKAPSDSAVGSSAKNNESQSPFQPC